MTFDLQSPVAPAIQAPLHKRSKLRFHYQVTQNFAPDTLTSNIYVWPLRHAQGGRGAVQSAISFDENTDSTSAGNSNTVWNTSYTLDGLGQLVSAYIADGKTRTVSYTNDESGQIIRRSESLPSNAPSGQTGTPHEIYYRYAGRQMGFTGNNGTNDQNAVQSVTERGTVSQANPGTFRGGSVIGSPYADFLGSYDPINSFGQGSGAGSYTVRAGDTLAGIAAALYGDASLWYKIAEANGLSGASGLNEGQQLRLPTGLMKAQCQLGKPIWTLNAIILPKG